MPIPHPPNFWNWPVDPVLAIAARDLPHPIVVYFYSLTTAKYCTMLPRRRQQMHKVAATKKTQPAPLRRESQVLTVLPTPDPALEGTDPAQKQRIGALTMLAEASLLIRNSQRPEPQREPDLFNDDDFLRDFSPITDREQSVVRKTVPPLLIRTSPARPKPNKFTNIAREIVGNREVVATIEEDE
jgi:hypothetical protein